MISSQPSAVLFWPTLRHTDVLSMNEQHYDEAKAVNEFDGMQDAGDIAHWAAAVEDYALCGSWAPIDEYTQYLGRCKRKKPQTFGGLKNPQRIH